MIEIKEKSECTGCTACKSVCPKHCISMEFDNEGYKYPIVDKTKCTDCRLCERICPCKQKQVFDDFKTLAYAVQNKHAQQRRESASGGAFSVMAERIINQGGVVYGGAYNDNFMVFHQRVDSLAELSKLRCSKYVQSEMGDTYTLVRSDLKAGKTVLFSGTPCQIAGLKQSLHGIDYADKLLLVDLVCHGIPSPLFWSIFVGKLSQKYGKLTFCSFRDKHFGYAGSTMAMCFEDGKTRYLNRDIQFYKKLFFDDINTRPSCFKCHFKTVKRVSDFTIFDCWHANKIDRSMDDDRGTTWVLVQSEKGKNFFENIKPQLRYVSAPVETAIQLDGMLATHCTTPNPKREEFFQDWNTMELEDLIDKYFPWTMKKQITDIVKPILGKLGLIRFVKR